MNMDFRLIPSLAILISENRNDRGLVLHNDFRNALYIHLLFNLYTHVKCSMPWLFQISYVMNKRNYFINTFTLITQFIFLIETNELVLKHLLAFTLVTTLQIGDCCFGILVLNCFSERFCYICAFWVYTLFQKLPINGILWLRKSHMN